MYTEIKTFKDACAKLGISKELPDVSMLRESNRNAVLANYKLDIIQEAINDGWVPDWNNRGEQKCYPWFTLSSSGVGFSFGAYLYDYSLSTVGSRRVFRSAELAIYVGKQFIDLYNHATFIQPNL